MTQKIGNLKRIALIMFESQCLLFVLVFLFQNNLKFIKSSAVDGGIKDVCFFCFFCYVVLLVTFQLACNYPPIFSIRAVFPSFFLFFFCCSQKRLTQERKTEKQKANSETHTHTHTHTHKCVYIMKQIQQRLDFYNKSFKLDKCIVVL